MNKQVRYGWSIIGPLVLTLALVLPVSGAVDMFIKIEGVDGESTDTTHAGEIDVLAWSWGMTQSGTFQDGSGGRGGRASFGDVSITKYVDKATPLLLQKCASGEHLPSATITVRKAGTQPLEYIIITMEKVLVTSVSTGGSGGEDRLTENVTLNFAKIRYEYTEQTPDGSAGGKSTMTWDIETNSP